MCLSSNKPKIPPPPAPPPPPPPEAPDAAAVGEDRKSAKKKRGRESLKISSPTDGTGGTGLKI